MILQQTLHSEILDAEFLVVVLIAVALPGNGENDPGYYHQREQHCRGGGAHHLQVAFGDGSLQRSFLTAHSLLIGRCRRNSARSRANQRQYDREFFLSKSLLLKAALRTAH
jgi:hypothetical protein